MENENTLQNPSKREFNYGFAILRTIMCFEVILNHYWKEKSNPPDLFIFKIFSIFTGFAVCYFFFLSFFLSLDVLVSKNSLKIKKRIWRIGYPQIAWALIYWGIYKIIQIKIDLGVDFSDLFWQLFTAHSQNLNGPMWYQVILLLITSIYIGIFYFAERKGLFIIWILLFLSLFLQYSGINYKLFQSTRYEIKWTFGRFIEMIPYATLGVTCAYYKIFDKLKQNRLNACILFSLFCCFFIKYWIIKPANGYGYEFDNRIVLVFFVTGLAYFLPFEYLPEVFLRILRTLTKYTLGIYCMHMAIGKLLNFILNKTNVTIDSFLVCIIIYVLGYFISYFMSKIPTKYVRDLVN